MLYTIFSPQELQLFLVSNTSSSFMLNTYASTFYFIAAQPDDTQAN